MKRFRCSRMAVGVLAGGLAGLIPTVLVAVGEDSPPDSPPAVTGPAIVQGSTWYSDGARIKAGGPGTQISAYAVGALANVPYRLILGLGADDKACEAPVKWINPTVVYTGQSGLIGRVTGTVPADTVPGIYKLCFEDSSNGNFTGTGGATFIVLDLTSPTVAPPVTTTSPPPPTSSTLPPSTSTTVVTIPPQTTTPLTIPRNPGPTFTVPTIPGFP